MYRTKLARKFLLMTNKNLSVWKTPFCEKGKMHKILFSGGYANQIWQEFVIVWISTTISFNIRFPKIF
jgi:hypothetical protein